ncbi:MAG: hypothetical protein NC405_09600 [Odoribacter sp.]|nr:hypothetical protein [Odoribacter sp.]
MNSNSTISSWTPTRLWEPLQIWTVSLANVKTAISSVACDWGDPYYGMDDLGSYAKIILISFIISIPFGVFRKKRIQELTFLCADIALAYYIFIIVGHMAGIISGLLMLMTTVILTLIYKQRQRLLCVPPRGKLQYCCYLLGWAVLAYLL